MRILIGLIGSLLLGISTVAQGETKAIAFNGTNTYIRLPNKITKGRTSFTVEAWVKWDAFKNWSRVFDFGREGNAIVVQNEKKGSKLHFAIWDRYGARYRVTAKNKVKKGSWHHIAVSSDGSEMAFYVDGQRVKGTGIGFRAQLKSAEPSTPTLADINTFGGGGMYIGKSNWPSDDLFAGSIAEFRIWNYARAESEIHEMLEQQASGSERGLVAYYRFSGSDATIQDLSLNGNDAVLEGEATFVSGPTIEEMPLADMNTLQAGWVKSLKNAQTAMLIDAWNTAITFLEDVRPVFAEYEQAQTLLLRAISTRDSVSGQYLQKGELAFQQGKYDESVEHLRNVEVESKHYDNATRMIAKAETQANLQKMLASQQAQVQEQSPRPTSALSDQALGDPVLHGGVAYFSGVLVETTDYDLRTAKQPLLVYARADPSQSVHGFVTAVSTLDAKHRLAIRCVVKPNSQTFGPITAKLQVQSYDPYKFEYNDLTSFDVIINDSIPANEFRAFVFAPVVSLTDLMANQELMGLWNHHRLTSDTGQFRWTFVPTNRRTSVNQSATQKQVTFSSITILPNTAADYCKVVAKINNPTGFHFDFVNVRAIIYDKAGKILDTDITSVTHLSSGSAKTFEVRFSVPRTSVGSCRVEVDGYRGR